MENQNSTSEKLKITDIHSGFTLKEIFLLPRICLFSLAIILTFLKGPARVRDLNMLRELKIRVMARGTPLHFKQLELITKRTL